MKYYCEETKEFFDTEAEALAAKESFDKAEADAKAAAAKTKKQWDAVVASFNKTVDLLIKFQEDHPTYDPDFSKANEDHRHLLDTMYFDALYYASDACSEAQNTDNAAEADANGDCDCKCGCKCNNSEDTDKDVNVHSFKVDEESLAGVAAMLALFDIFSR